MAFSFRRSVRIGGVRLDLSPAGIFCSSCPVKVFRIATELGASSTAPPHGFYYQERLDKTISPNDSAEEAPGPNAGAFPGDDALPFIDATSYRMIAEINRRRSTMRLAPIAGGMFGLITFLLFAHDLQLIGLMAVILTVVTTVRAAQHDRRQRSTVLHYNLGDRLSQFNERQRICQILLGSEKVWRVNAQRSTADSKGNADADSHWSRNEVMIGRGRPSCIEANVEIWSIDAGHLKLYFFPDFLFVFQSGKYATVSYESLTAQVLETPFIEHSSLPRDARIAGYTWKYPRIDGGPDPRFGRNRQLPIAMYGLLILTSSDGLNICLQCSNRESAFEAADQIEHPKPQRPEQAKPQRPEQAKPQRPDTARNWEPPKSSRAAGKADYDTLQVSIAATDEEITAAYIHLAKMYHPDKVEGLAPEYKVIGIARMKEINEAYARLRLRRRGQ